MFLLNQNDRWKLEFRERVRVDRRRVPIQRVERIEPYLEEYEFFTLAPLYVHAGVTYSMPDQFEAENSACKRLVIDYCRTVIDGLGRWGRFVEGIEKRVWDPFCRYVMSSLFVAQTRGLVWQPRIQNVGLEGTASRVVSPRDLPVSLWVWLPDGNRGRMILKPGSPATLHWTTPNPKIVSMAETILACRGRLDQR